VNLHDYDIRYEALQEGAHQQAEKSAINMLAEGDSPEKVSRCTGLPLDEVLKLQKPHTDKA